ncbi:MAG: hypothetical protein H6915_01810 [Novosphingobium sp.]|nr:hypothetical protein [Novosphingobium sp.]MCP5379390.1 hypothetical protein [Novosphingobium sp.]MCP5388477.1 hypothetical protein [Novosphingobium sp.]
MRWILLAVFVFLAGCSSGDALPSDQGASSQQKLNPFPDAAEVRLFVESGEYRNQEAVFTNPDGQSMTKEQRKVLENAISVKRIEPDQAFAACFIPHHFFRYYDAVGKQLGEISVCFCCAGVRIDSSDRSAKFEIDEDHYLAADYAGLETLVKSMGEPTDIECE